MKKNHHPTKYVHGRQRKRSQQNWIQSCTKVGVTLTKSAVSRKADKQERKKETCKLGGSKFTPVCNQKSLKFHSDDLSKRCRGIGKQKTNTSQTLKMMTAGQFIKLYYHKRIITAMNVCVSALPVLH